MQVAMLLLLALLPQLVDRTKEPLHLEPPDESLSAERRGDVFMVRKMYREGVETYEEGSRQQPSARLYNKIGIGYHHLGRFSRAATSRKQAPRVSCWIDHERESLGKTCYRPLPSERIIEKILSHRGLRP